jgi:chorismate synthase
VLRDSDFRGIGEPMFGGVENRIAQAVFGIPAVRGLAFGAGFSAARMRGSENNDPFVIRDGRVATKTNNHGGVLGGITSGMPLLFRAGDQAHSFHRPCAAHRAP